MRADGTCRVQIITRLIGRGKRKHLLRFLILSELREATLHEVLLCTIEILGYRVAITHRILLRDLVCINPIKRVRGRQVIFRELVKVLLGGIQYVVVSRQLL